jgi:hypothetical protein
MIEPLWRQLAPQLEHSFLTLLAENLHPSIEADEVQDWSQRELFEMLRNGFVRFDAPDHVCIHAVSEGSIWYPATVAARDLINEALQASPGSLLAPLMPDEAAFAQCALDDNQFIVCDITNGDRSRVFSKYISARWAAPHEIYEVAKAVDATIDCVCDQTGGSKMEHKTLAFVAELLEWCRAAPEGHPEEDEAWPS